MQYAADLTVILSFWKLKDEREDGGLLRRLGADVLLLLFRRAYRRAAQRQPEFAAVVQRQLQLLREFPEGQHMPGMGRIKGTAIDADPAHRP